MTTLSKNIEELTNHHPNQIIIGSEKISAIEKLLKILQQPLSRVPIENTPEETRVNQQCH